MNSTQTVKTARAFHNLSENNKTITTGCVLFWKKLSEKNLSGKPFLFYLEPQLGNKLETDSFCCYCFPNSSFQTKNVQTVAHQLFEMTCFEKLVHHSTYFFEFLSKTQLASCFVSEAGTWKIDEGVESRCVCASKNSVQYMWNEYCLISRKNVKKIQIFTDII